MARTIGRKNSDKVIAETQHLFASGVDEDTNNFVGLVAMELYDRYPEMFDIWESAHEEIQRIIWDVYTEARHEHNAN